MSECKGYSSDEEGNEARQCLSSSDVDDSSCIPRKRKISEVCYDSPSSEDEDNSSGCRSSDSRELTNRRLSHDGAVGSPYSPPSSSCRNLNLRFAVKTTTFMRDRQIFPPFLNFVFIF